MGDCKFCGEPAGFFRRQHKECSDKNAKGCDKIAALAQRLAMQGGDVDEISSRMTKISEEHFVSQRNIKMLVADVWEKVVEAAFDDHVLTVREESNLMEFARHFSLTDAMMDKHGTLTRLQNGALLRQINKGDYPPVIGPVPFNLQKSETLVWVLRGVDYHEERTRTHYQGGSRGVSVRVARGLYYRTGSFRGERVQTAETVHADTGILGLTTKHIYFAGKSKRFRVRYDKIVAFEPFADGIGIQKDAASARPQSFVTGDGWFVHNLVTLLASKM